MNATAPTNVFTIDFQNGCLKPASNATFPVGQIVAYDDRANPYQEAVVVGAERGPYGQRCVFLDDGHQSDVTPAYCDEPGGWTKVDRAMTPEEMTAALTQAETNRHQLAAAKQQAKEQKAQAENIEQQKILKDFPWLARVTNAKPCFVWAATNIKRELTRAFPNTKWSVTTKSYTGGNRVSIGWTDGPQSNAVSKIVAKYEDHDFDGMQDLSTATPTAWTNTFGGTKCLSYARNISRSLHQKAADKLNLGTLEFGKWDEITNLDATTAGKVYELARELE